MNGWKYIKKYLSENERPMGLKPLVFIGDRTTFKRRKPVKSNVKTRWPWKRYKLTERQALKLGAVKCPCGMIHDHVLWVERLWIFIRHDIGSVKKRITLIPSAGVPKARNPVPPPPSRTDDIDEMYYIK